MFDEIGRRHVGQRFIETHDDHLLDMVPRKGPHFVAQAADLRGYQFGALAALCKIGARMRIERQDGGRQVDSVRLLAHSGENRLMAAVHAVDIADGDGAWAVAVEAGQGKIDSWRDRTSVVKGKSG